ncbi:hypothetical protein [Streptomyces kanamyceticus]|uniref:hypothetical protein n=1 Tax=Streptomyces kanamyceticus TaxID=1967 RepID=UPI001CC7310E|nr:hypothetical protein [Streptomyces kanamyceticus]
MAAFQAPSADRGRHGLALLAEERVEGAQGDVVVGRDVRGCQLRIAEVVVDEGVDAGQHRLTAGVGRQLLVRAQVLGQTCGRQVEGDRAEAVQLTGVAVGAVGVQRGHESGEDRSHAGAGRQGPGEELTHPVHRKRQAVVGKLHDDHFRVAPLVGYLALEGLREVEEHHVAEDEPGVLAPLADPQRAAGHERQLVRARV